MNLKHHMTLISHNYSKKLVIYELELKLKKKLHKNKKKESRRSLYSMVESTLELRESIQMPNQHLNPILLLYIVLGFDDF